MPLKKAYSISNVCIYKYKYVYLSLWVGDANGMLSEWMVIAGDKHAEHFVYNVARNQLNYGTQRVGQGQRRIRCQDNWAANCVARQMPKRNGKYGWLHRCLAVCLTGWLADCVVWVSWPNASDKSLLNNFEDFFRHCPVRCRCRCPCSFLLPYVKVFAFLPRCALHCPIHLFEFLFVQQLNCTCAIFVWSLISNALCDYKEEWMKEKMLPDCTFCTSG